MIFVFGEKNIVKMYRYLNRLSLDSSFSEDESYKYFLNREKFLESRTHNIFMKLYVPKRCRVSKYLLQIDECKPTLGKQI